MQVLNTNKPYIARGKPMARISSEGHTKYWDWSQETALNFSRALNM